MIFFLIRKEKKWKFYKRRGGWPSLSGQKYNPILNAALRRIFIAHNTIGMVFDIKMAPPKIEFEILQPIL